MQTNGLENRFQPTVAVIGAGISGLTCARTLADHGLPVTVFEKSRGVGGRMATRRSANGVRSITVRSISRFVTNDSRVTWTPGSTPASCSLGPDGSSRFTIKTPNKISHRRHASSPVPA